MHGSGTAVIKVLPSIGEVDADAWDACASPDPAVHNPFVSHAFLKALEDAGTVGGRSGWQPQHLVLEDGAGGVAGAAPAYFKMHSRGEYVFDDGWAEAYENAGGSYYPKLQLAVPFTPVPGRRLLVPPSAESEQRERLLALGAVELAKRLRLSSVHATFLSAGEWERLAGLGFLQRTDRQFHWHNQGYRTFDDFLATLASRKRKAIRKERAEALGDGVEIEWITGSALSEARWDAFFKFYMDTGSRKWGRPYLNRRFFSLLGAAMPERCLLVMAKRSGRPIAGALNVIGGDCLYGRYWGAIERHHCLHFEVCYYQAIEFAITHGLPRVEAGAQGSHKLARGYMPVATHSAHWIRDAGFRRAVERYLVQEREYVAAERSALVTSGPYRKAVQEEC